jgi:hypothetical protein
VRGRRAAAGALAAVLLGAGAAGCQAGAFGKREIVVHFAPGATEAQHVAARAACAHAAPHASPEPMVHNAHRVTYINDVRFRVDRADDHDLAKLVGCLARQPGVIGYDDSRDLTG